MGLIPLNILTSGTRVPDELPIGYLGNKLPGYGSPNHMVPILVAVSDFNGHFSCFKSHSLEHVAHIRLGFTCRRM